MTFYIAPIVEGQTEAGCIERLLHRVWTELLVAPDRLQVLPPSRGKRDALVAVEEAGFAAKIEEAFAKLSQRLRRDAESRGLVLLLVDAEDDCPAELGPRLLAAAQQHRTDADIACVIAKRMLENWIVAGASALGGVNGLPDVLPACSDVEERGGANWLDRQIRSRNAARKYKKTVDAEAFVKVMALADCRTNAPSFDKLCRELQARITQLPLQDAGPA